MDGSALTFLPPTLTNQPSTTLVVDRLRHMTSGIYQALPLFLYNIEKLGVAWCARLFTTMTWHRMSVQNSLSLSLSLSLSIYIYTYIYISHTHTHTHTNFLALKDPYWPHPRHSMNKVYMYTVPQSGLASTSRQTGLRNVVWTGGNSATLPAVGQSSATDHLRLGKGSRDMEYFWFQVHEHKVSVIPWSIMTSWNTGHMHDGTFMKWQ